ncbi:DUF47 domain-containing protein [Haliovirga abyssi]|uniref:DUF47 family protein n=1 Tax=Haliovirga abyssi TaxID=2996794 RepID=A0AAU9D3Z6_9FUSO|nr:DUF47 family protein [Haliovirga abyssi]BDU50696.1 hypothetical protein HLVA_12650 [Haliovirga abyssi]
MSKKIRIEDLRLELESYMDKVIETYKQFEYSIVKYMEQGLILEVEDEFLKIHKLEYEADILRRKLIENIIKSEMLLKSMEEFIRLIELIDKIANMSETIIDNILVKKIDENKIDINIIKEILTITENQVLRLKDAVSNLFLDFDIAYKKARELEIDEQSVDELERKCLKKLRDSEISLNGKIYYRDFINKIADISDLIEDIGDEVEKISTIRRV